VIFGTRNYFRRFILDRRKLRHKSLKISGPSKIKLFLTLFLPWSAETDWAVESYSNFGGFFLSAAKSEWTAENRKIFLLPHPAGPLTPLTLTHTPALVAAALLAAGSRVAATHTAASCAGHARPAAARSGSASLGQPRQTPPAAARLARTPPAHARPTPAGTAHGPRPTSTPPPPRQCRLLPDGPTTARSSLSPLSPCQVRL
jgi:hypothetical protein